MPYNMENYYDSTNPPSDKLVVLKYVSFNEERDEWLKKKKLAEDIMNDLKGITNLDSILAKKRKVDVGFKIIWMKERFDKLFMNGGAQQLADLVENVIEIDELDGKECSQKMVSVICDFIDNFNQEIHDACQKTNHEYARFISREMIDRSNEEKAKKNNKLMMLKKIIMFEEPSLDKQL